MVATKAGKAKGCGVGWEVKLRVEPNQCTPNPGALEPAWTPLPSGLLVGGARENRPEPGTILTDGLDGRRFAPPYIHGAVGMWAVPTLICA
ncbi:unnamed protein product [Boreogadus saida]